MAAIVPNDFVRVKYRKAAIEPELNEEDRTEGKALSMAKKMPPPAEDVSDEIKNLRFKPPVMLPAHTQNTRVEQVVYSDDKEYRKIHKPTLFEKVEIQRSMAKSLLRDAKNEADIEKQKNATREKLAKLAAQAASGRAEEDEVEEEGGGAEEQKTGATKANAEADYEQETEHMDEEDAAEFRKIRLELKEKKCLRTRNSHEFHFPVNKWKRRRLAFKLAFNFGTRSSGGFTEVLPWLLLSSKDEAMNQHHLIQQGITHIMNVTEDVPNEFPQAFVYMKVPIKDSEDSDIGERFPSVVAFFQRVESKRGKILVHCSVGACRAPAMIMAYLVADRKVPLSDAYAYIRAIRPVVALNDHFLFQLAQLELKQGYGCSVLFHKDWYFYEFNMIKADIDPKADYRPYWGLFETTLRLYRKRDDEENHVARF